MQLELCVRGCETNASFEKREMTSGLLAALLHVSVKFSHGVHSVLREIRLAYHFAVIEELAEETYRQNFFPVVENAPDEYFRFSLAGFHVRLRLDDIANLPGRAWVPVIEVSVAQLLENLLSCQRARAALLHSAKLVL